MEEQHLIIDWTNALLRKSDVKIHCSVRPEFQRGGCGFIGSNLVLHLAKKYPNYKLVNLDLVTYASDASYLESLGNRLTNG